MKISLFVLCSLFVFGLTAPIFIGATHINNQNAIDFGATTDLAVKLAIEYLEQIGIGIPLYSTAIYGSTTNVSAVVSNLFDDGAVAMVGPALTDMCVAVSLNVATPRKKPMISYSATSPVLSNKVNHPYFLRTIPHDSKGAEVMIDLCHTYDWLEIGTLASNDIYGSSGALITAQIAKQKGVNVKIETTFTIANVPETTDAIQRIKQSGVKVIMVWCTNGGLQTVLLVANSLGMIGTGYTWIFSDSLPNLFTISSGNNAVTFLDPSLQSIGNGLIYLTTTQGIWDKSSFVYDQWILRTIDHRTITNTNRFAFDGVLAVAFALKAMIQKGLNYSDGDLLLEELKKVSFIGSTGYVRFDSNGDRVGGIFEINNIMNNTKFLSSYWDDGNGLSVQTPTLYVGGPFTYRPTSETKQTLAGQKKWAANPDPSLPPAPVNKGLLVTYAKRDQIVVFGGKNRQDGPSDKIFLFDVKSGQWLPQAAVSKYSPNPRYLHGGFLMDDSLVIYGGFDDSSYYYDMWEFSFVTNQWTQLKFDGFPTPGVRYGFSFIVIGRKAYLFGGELPTGQTSTMGQDLWEFNYDTKKWRLLSDNVGPSPRTEYCGVSDANDIIIYGGRGTNGLQHNDMWRYSMKRTEFKSNF